jgi:hypothetical protein
MILIKRVSDNVVLYADDSAVLAADGTFGDGWQDTKTTTDNAVVDNGTPPTNFYGGCFSYVDGAWTQVSAPPAPPVPQSVTAFQAKAALLNAGLYNVVNTYMTTTAPQIDQLAWQEAASFWRDDAMIAALMVPLNLTSAQLDALFVAAAQLAP